MKNHPGELHPTPKPAPEHWRLDTLRPFLKKFQQNLIRPSLETTCSIEHDLPQIFDSDEEQGKLS
jgi:hypothetical protein